MLTLEDSRRIKGKLEGWPQRVACNKAESSLQRPECSACHHLSPAVTKKEVHKVEGRKSRWQAERDHWGKSKLRNANTIATTSTLRIAAAILVKLCLCVFIVTDTDAS